MPRNYVYAVVYNDDAPPHRCYVLVATKLALGYFFGDSLTSQGRVYANGRPLHGATLNCLPGGELVNETVRAGAFREFWEETGYSVAGQPVTDTHTWQDPSGSQYSASYISTTMANMNVLVNNARAISLTQAAQAARDIQAGTIRQYSQIHLPTAYPDAPGDNELSLVQMWDILDPATWAKIQTWQGDPNLGWYYDILDRLHARVMPLTAARHA